MTLVVGGFTLSAAYVREFIFQNEAFLENYTKGLRGPWYIKDKTVNEDGSVHAVIISSYNNAPLWGGEDNGKYGKTLLHAHLQYVRQGIRKRKQ